LASAMMPGRSSTFSLSFQSSSPIHFWASPIWRRKAWVSSFRAAAGGGATGFTAAALPTSASTRAAARRTRRRCIGSTCLCATPKRVKSRTEPFEQAREGDRLAYVVQAAEPRDASLDAHAEARVRHRAEAAEIEIPVDRLARQLVLGPPGFEPRQVVL